VDEEGMFGIIKEQSAAVIKIHVIKVPE